MPDLSEPIREGGGYMESMFSFILSVAAGVISNYISKWLDGQFKDGKH